MNRFDQDCGDCRDEKCQNTGLVGRTPDTETCFTWGDATNCQNEGCGSWCDMDIIRNCNSRISCDDCGNFTTEPTVSITKANLTELKNNYETVSHNNQWLNEEYKEIELKFNKLRNRLDEAVELLEKVVVKMNPVTAEHRHGHLPHSKRLDALSDFQLEIEKFLTQGKRHDQTR